MVVVFLFLFPTVGGDAIVGLSLWFWWLGVVIIGGGDTDNGCRGCGGGWVASGWVSFIAGGLWWVVVVFFLGGWRCLAIGVGMGVGLLGWEEICEFVGWIALEKRATDGKRENNIEGE